LSLSIILCFSFQCILAQSNLPEQIKHVENGLTKDDLIVSGTTLQKGNICERMKSHHVNGVSIAIIDHGEIQWSKCYGIKDAENSSDSVTRETLFQLAEHVLAFWHAGNTAGYISLIYGLTIIGQGAVIMTNSDSGELLSMEIIRSIANTYNWPVTQTKTVNNLTDQDYIKYTGKYQAAKEAPMIIETNNKRLLLKSTTSPKQSFNLFQLSDGTFKIKAAQDKFRLVFETNNQEQVTGIKILQNAGNTNISLLKLNN
jgi:hypothetical protein